MKTDSKYPHEYMLLTAQYVKKSQGKNPLDSLMALTCFPIIGEAVERLEVLGLLEQALLVQPAAKYCF